MSRSFINIGDLDPSILLDSVDRSATEIDHSHRRQKLYAALFKDSPSLADVVDAIGLNDPNETPEGESHLAKGALMALKAVADFSRDTSTDYDVRDDATSDYLSELDPNDLAEAYEAARQADLEAADEKLVKQYTFIRDRLSASYPGIVEFIPEMTTDHMHRSKEFRNGMWLGAIQLLLAIDAMVSGQVNIGMRSSEITKFLNERSVDPDASE